MILLNTNCCYIIWKFVGKNAIYLNKDLLNFLNKKREEFVNNPINIYYRLARLKEIRYNTDSVVTYSRTPRPSMRVEKELHLIKLNGETPVGLLMYGNKVNPSTELYNKIIPPPTRDDMSGSRNFFERYKIQYWEIFTLFTDLRDMERAKLYQYLFPAKSIHKINLLNVF